MLTRPPHNIDEVDALCYVPSPRWKLLLRGFNPAELLARRLAKQCHKPLLHDVIRCHGGHSQKHLSRSQRARNTQGAFLPGHSKLGVDITGLRLLLIDDVMTTGNTVEAVASVLKQLGASGVDVWCLARTPKPGF